MLTDEGSPDEWLTLHFFPLTPSARKRRITLDMLENARLCRKIPSSVRERAIFRLAKMAKQAILASSSMQPDAVRREISRSKPDRVFRQCLRPAVMEKRYRDSFQMKGGNPIMAVFSGSVPIWRVTRWRLPGEIQFLTNEAIHLRRYMEKHIASTLAKHRENKNNEASASTG